MAGPATRIRAAGGERLSGGGGCVRVLDALISVIRNSDAFDQSVFKRFRAKIRLEDHHSQTPLALAVPDWAPYL